jgi:hypothetical protein
VLVQSRYGTLVPFTNRNHDLYSPLDTSHSYLIVGMSDVLSSRILVLDFCKRPCHGRAIPCILRKEFDTMVVKGLGCVQDASRILDRLSGNLHATKARHWVRNARPHHPAIFAWIPNHRSSPLSPMSSLDRVCSLYRIMHQTSSIDIRALHCDVSLVIGSGSLKASR